MLHMPFPEVLPDYQVSESTRPTQSQRWSDTFLLPYSTYNQAARHEQQYSVAAGPMTHSHLRRCLLLARTLPPASTPLASLGHCTRGAPLHCTTYVSPGLAENVAASSACQFQIIPPPHPKTSNDTVRLCSMHAPSTSIPTKYRPSQAGTVREGSVQKPPIFSIRRFKHPTAREGKSKLQPQPASQIQESQVNCCTSHKRS